MLPIYDCATNQRRPGLLPRFRVLRVFEPVFRSQIREELCVLDWDQLPVYLLCRWCVPMLIPFVENDTVLLFLAHVAGVLLLVVTVVRHSPLVPMIDLEETLLHILVLPRILIEYQFRKVELSGQNNTIHS